MNRAVWIDGTRVALEPAALLGQGGEAEVYDLGDGRVLKWWKPADHPDFDGVAAAQAAAARRLAERRPSCARCPATCPRRSSRRAAFALAASRRGRRLRDAEGRRASRCTRSASRAGAASTRSTATTCRDLLALHDAIAGAPPRRRRDRRLQRPQRPGRRPPRPPDRRRQLPVRLASVRDVQRALRRSAPVRRRHARAGPPARRASDWFAFAVDGVALAPRRAARGAACSPADPRGAARRRARAAPGQRLRTRRHVPARRASARDLPDGLPRSVPRDLRARRRGVFPRGALERLRAAAAAPRAASSTRACAVRRARPRRTCRRRSSTVACAGRDRASRRRLDAEPTRSAATTAGLARGGRAVCAGPARTRADRQRARRRRPACGSAAGSASASIAPAATPSASCSAPIAAVSTIASRCRSIRGQLVDAHATIGDDRAWLWLTLGRRRAGSRPRAS